MFRFTTDQKLWSRELIDRIMSRDLSGLKGYA
jgi:hypothetical protein